MPAARQLTWFATLACVLGVLAFAQPSAAQSDGIALVKLGFDSMSKDDRKNLWKLVDQYATVDALQEFCGIKLNLQQRAWRAVSACVETSALRRVLSVFRTKKAEYLKAWETLHGEPEKKKAVCDRFRVKLVEYARVMRGQIEEAATMCRNCFFC